jgi:hypothetical protein
MFSVLKFIWIVFKAFPGLLDVDRNALKNVPDASKYLAMVMLSCFWCLAFGLYVGELLTIGYNMIGHIAIVTMAFVTGWLFRSINQSGSRGIDYLRMPDKSSRCDEYTDEQREQLARRI